jgi:hypothetical protein
MAKAWFNKVNYLALLLFPIILGTSFVAIEWYLSTQVTVDDAFGGQVPESIKEAIKLNNDLANLFVSLSTAIIAGIAYYLKVAYKEFTEYTMFSRITAAGTLFSAILSIFFGHLWIAGMRNQLVNDYFNISRAELVWPERMQYYMFIVALCWFGLLALEREQFRSKKPQTE